MKDMNHFKKTFIAAALAASFAAPAFAYELPERPTIPVFSLDLPTEPVYQDPELLPILPPPESQPFAPVGTEPVLGDQPDVGEAPQVLLYPSAPVAPTRSYTYLAPPLATVSTGIVQEANGYWHHSVSMTAEQIATAITSTLQSSPDYGTSDYYETLALPEVDRVLGTYTVNPNFTYNTRTENTLMVWGGAGRFISSETNALIDSVLAGETISHDGEDITAVWVVVGSNGGFMYTREGAFMMSNGQIWGLPINPPSPVPFNLSVIDSASLGYAAYQQYLADNSDAIAAYKSAYAVYQGALASYPTDLEAYSASQSAYLVWEASAQAAYQAWQDAYYQELATWYAENESAYWQWYAENEAAYTAWLEENNHVQSYNSAALYQAQQQYEAALADYEVQRQDALVNAIVAMPLNRSMGGGYAPGVNAAAFGPAAIAAGEAATALGADAFAYGQSSTAVGDSAVAVGLNGTALGAGTIAVGDDATAVGSGSVAVGAGSFAAGNAAYAEGSNAVAIGTGSVAVNANAVAMGSNALAIGGVAIGDGAISETDISVAIGRGARAVSSVAVGTGAQALGLNTTAVGDFAVAAGDLSVSVGANAVALGENSVALGAGTVATRDDSVSVGGRQITDVADGTALTDAVNVRQLETAIAAVPTFDGTFLEQRVDQLSSRVDQVESQIKEVEKTASKGVAMAMAMSQPVMLTADKPSAVTAGLGHYNGQTAVGIAVTSVVRANVVSSFGAAFSNGGKAALRAGVSFSF